MRLIFSFFLLGVCCSVLPQNYSIKELKIDPEQSYLIINKDSFVLVHGYLSSSVKDTNNKNETKVTNGILVEIEVFNFKSSDSFANNSRSFNFDYPSNFILSNTQENFFSINEVVYRISHIGFKVIFEIETSLKTFYFFMQFNKAENFERLLKYVFTNFEIPRNTAMLSKLVDWFGSLLKESK